MTTPTQSEDEWEGEEPKRKSRRYFPGQEGRRPRPREKEKEQEGEGDSDDTS